MRKEALRADITHIGRSSSHSRRRPISSYSQMPSKTGLKVPPESDRRRVSTVRTHQKSFKTAQDAEYLFGREWFVYHHLHNFGVYVGQLVFTLQKITTLQFMTEEDLDGTSTVIPGTRASLTASFLHVSFLFCREVRPVVGSPFYDEYNWRTRVEELMEQEHPRRIHLRPSDRMRKKK